MARILLCKGTGDLRQAWIDAGCRALVAVLISGRWGGSTPGRTMAGTRFWLAGVEAGRLLAQASISPGVVWSHSMLSAEPSPRSPPLFRPLDPADVRRPLRRKPDAAAPPEG